MVECQRRKETIRRGKRSKRSKEEIELTCFPGGGDIGGVIGGKDQISDDDIKGS